MSAAEFEQKLEASLKANVEGVEALVKVERLSGGASQETYRIEVQSGGETRLLAMRRAPGGEIVEPTPGHPGLAVEALLMQTARDAGVPEPEVFHVLSVDEGLGEGFIMEMAGWDCTWCASRSLT